MHDVDGNFCDGNGKLLPRTGEEYAAQLESERKKSAPMTTEEERKAAAAKVDSTHMRRWDENDDDTPQDSLRLVAIDLQCALTRTEKEHSEMWDAVMSQSVGLRHDYETKVFSNERAEVAEKRLELAGGLLRNSKRMANARMLQLTTPVENQKEIARYARIAIDIETQIDAFLNRESSNCTHDKATNFACPDCGAAFVLCPGCSEAGGANDAIYHMAPICKLNPPAEGE